MAAPASRSPVTPTSQLDPALRQFADPSFDPAKFLNSSLPSLTFTRPATTAAAQRTPSPSSSTASLPELSSRVHALQTQLNSQNARLSNTLTQSTDEILRGGSRLAYEVELLRGQAVGLADVFTESLQDDLRKFLPEEELRAAENGKSPKAKKGSGNTADRRGEEEEEEAETEAAATTTRSDADAGDQDSNSLDPEYIKNLRTLNLVRSRLDQVVRAFGEAIDWPVSPPPSEASVASSFISVTAPETSKEDQLREEQSRAAVKRLRSEISDLLNSDGGGRAGVESARKRVQELRQLATVWRGTAEEVSRTQLVDSFQKMVDDRNAQLIAQASRNISRENTPTPSSHSRREQPPQETSATSGLLRNLQRLRDEIYMD